MKRFMTLLSLTISFASFAAEIPDCKAIAEEAAFEAYTAKYGESIIFTKSKYKPMTENNSIIHIIQIIDADRGSNDIVTVTLNKNTCKVVSID
jgi:hypothetical protein